MFLTRLTKASKGIRFRLTVVYSTLFGVFICFFAFILTSQFLDEGQKDFDAALFNYALDLSDAVKLAPSGFKADLSVHPSEMHKQFPFKLKDTYYFIRDIDGDVLLKSHEIAPFISYNPDIANREDYSNRYIDLKYGGKEYRAINLKLSLGPKQNYIVQAATPSSMLREQRTRYLWINVITIPFMILISSIAAYLIAGSALDPIKEVIRAANNIAAKNLSLRIPVFNSGDEVEELSKTLNSLLERLEGSFRAQEHFVANASHQLNTPLSIIKGELDVLESKQRSPEEISKFHTSLREELERLIELVKQMLLVSRVESGLESFIFNPVRLDEVVLATTARLRPKAKEKRISVRFDIQDEHTEGEDLVVQGDRQLIDCLIENLLENSIKYSPEDSSIRILMEKSPSALSVSIMDEGPGIEDGDLTKIKSLRFQRSAVSIMPGTGIGLSIAYKIASFHSAEITYKQLSPTGSCFRVDFPAADPLSRS